MYLVLLYFLRYCTVRLKMFSYKLRKPVCSKDDPVWPKIKINKILKINKFNLIYNHFLHPRSSTPWTSPFPTHHPTNPLLPLHPTHPLALKPLLTPPRACYPISPSPPPPPWPWLWSQSQHMFPLGEVAGPEGPTRVHVPFSLSDMSQIEEKLGSFSENPTRYRKELLRLSQAYNLTWSDVYIVS